MAEWLKAHAWKACVRLRVPWVRIPPPPPHSPVHGPCAVNPGMGTADQGPWLPLLT